MCRARRASLQRAAIGVPAGLFPLYCFDEDKPILRTAGSLGTYTTLNTKVGSLDGHYLATELKLTDGEKIFATAQLEQGNLLKIVTDADFAPPATAIASSPLSFISIDQKALPDHWLGGDPPHYPADAKQARLEGIVVLSVLVGEDGRISDAEVLSAPDYRLALPVLAAARSWRYKPYLLNGKPVRVETEINVIYKLGG